MAPVSLKSILSTSPKARTEAERVEPILVESLASPLAIEKRRMEARVLTIAKSEPEAMVTILLRQFDTKNAKAREEIKKLLKKIAEDREGQAAILENLSHPDQDVRKGVRMIMVSIWGESMGTYTSNYEQATMLIGMAKSREIFVDDIVTLIELSKVTLLEGDMDRALNDISLIVDLIKHRYRSVETMKNYLADMLKITPELSRLGMASGRIEESLRNAIRASKNRSFDLTQDMINDRMKEVDMIDQVRALGVTIKDQISEAPRMSLDQMNAMDVLVITRLKEVVRTGSSFNVTDRKNQVIDLVDAFLKDELYPYLRDHAQDRLTTKDPSLIYVVYTVGLTCLKLISDALPKVAEELYVTYFRDLEETESITAVSWPSIVI
ncbi:MAG: hypothetical protein LUQ09_03880 [Methanomassiliicoccales archaeon]|nr:hypothetical protein [Methanomassiliicoccales archaeon]